MYRTYRYSFEERDNKISTGQLTEKNERNERKQDDEHWPSYQ